MSPTFRTDRNLFRVYDLEVETGGKVSLEETGEGTLLVRREGTFSGLSAQLPEGIEPLLAHFVRYGNLPLPEDRET